jgi:hypothetical protein
MSGTTVFRGTCGKCHRVFSAQIPEPPVIVLEDQEGNTFQIRPGRVYTVNCPYDHTLINLTYGYLKAVLPMEE